MKKFEVSLGEEFDVGTVKVEASSSDAEEHKVALEAQKARTKERITYVVLGAIGIALLIATAIGMASGSYAGVGQVWTAVSVPLGFILKGYFPKD